MINGFGLPNFVTALREAGCDERAAHWLYHRMIGIWCIPDPRSETPNNIDRTDWFDFLVEGTIVVGRFLPTDAELINCIQQYKFTKFVDFAKAVTHICQHGPAIDNDVLLLASDSCSKETWTGWSVLVKLNPYSYNNQFAIRCVLDDHICSRVCTPRHFIHKAINWVGKTVAWLNDNSLSRFLTDSGYQPLTGPEVSPQRWDVIEFKKNSNVSPFHTFAIVTRMDASGFVAEFKPDSGQPPMATARGLNMFFLRDPAARMATIWRAPKNQ